MTTTMHIRAERSTDHDAVFAVNKAAFETDEEARLVDILRESAEPTLSLVATSGKKIIGHIFFSPVTIGESNAPLVMGLAPMAVLPAHQRQGIGSALVTRGLEACRLAGVAAVVVLGHPDYYPRFGFTPASTFGLSCEYKVPNDTFMALEIVAHSLSRHRGVVHYHPAFGKI